MERRRTREREVGKRERVEEKGNGGRGEMGRTSSTDHAKWAKLLGTPSPTNFTPPSQHHIIPSIS